MKLIESFAAFAVLAGGLLTLLAAVRNIVRFNQQRFDQFFVFYRIVVLSMPASASTQDSIVNPNIAHEMEGGKTAYHGACT